MVFLIKKKSLTYPALQLPMMKSDPQRIDKAIVTNVEAYDQWPSKPELPYLRTIVSPLTGPMMFEALKYSAVQRKVFSIAVEDEAYVTTALAFLLDGTVSIEAVQEAADVRATGDIQ